MGRWCAALTCWLWLTTAGAETLEVPFAADTRVVLDRVTAALGLDAAGRGELAHDACNRVTLSDPVVRPAPERERLTVSMAFSASTGVPAGNFCLTPGHWEGRLRTALAPTVAPSGLAVDFAAQSAELRRADGSAGLLSAPTRLLAERLVLPRLERVRVDLTETLAALDALLATTRPEDAPRPVPTRLLGVRVLDDGLEATLAIHAPPIPEAQREPPLQPGELERWARHEDALDGFLTHVIATLADPVERDLQLDLLAVLLDARHAIARALAAEQPGEDPVRRLFIDSWERLRPHLTRIEATSAGADLRLAAFMAGGDALRALDALGPAYGAEISRDGLRRLARLLLADAAPADFTPLPLQPDPALRELFGLGRPAPERGGTPDAGAPGWLEGLIPPAHAQGPAPEEALRGWVPRLANLQEYLSVVTALLEQQTAAYLSGNARLPARLEPRFEPLVQATAWKESCWRQLTGSPENPQVLTSAVGALGMMQINGRVWRGLYDLDRLAAEVDYNVLAGIEILEHYLVDYAIRHGEHERPGGDDNLIRATYAAYNGGPSQLSRYRREDTATRLQAIDNEFWRHFRALESEGEPDVASCYAVGS